MLRNVEIKAKVQNLTDLLKRAKDASKSSGTILKQVDVFFHSKTGRLKLRDEVSLFIAFSSFYIVSISLCCTRKTRKEKRHG
jgi:adenylate cyclase class IV